MILSIFHYQFIQYAIIGSILASIVCGIIGVIIVEKKLVMMSGGIAHISYGGVGLGYLLGIEPIIGAFFISICAAFGIGKIKRYGRTNSDIVIGIFWSFGMALGILFILMMPGYPPELSSYLFGNILPITKYDLYLMVFITFIVMLIILSMYNYWKLYMFDEEFMTIMGINISFFDYMILILIAMSVVVLIRVIGIILVLSLFTAPTAISQMLTKTLKSRIWLSIIFGVIFCFIGLFTSYAFNVASGAMIVIIATISYLFVYLGSNLKNKLKKLHKS